MAAETRPQYLDELAMLAASRDVPMLIQPRAVSPSFLEFIRRVEELAPDLIVCDSYSMLLPEEILRIPDAGAINVHGGILPEYRGSNPIQWAIIEGESQAGVTMHYMDKGFDTGDIIACRRVPLFFTDTWLDVRDRIGNATEELMSEQLPLLLKGRASRFPQEKARARHHRRRKAEDGRIDWSHPVRDIYNLIRALVSPMPGAHYVASGKVHVLDSYLTVAEVAALKQQLVPPRPLKRDTCQIRVVNAKSNDPVAFAVVDVAERPAGSAQLTQIDYENGLAKAQIDLDSDVCDRAATRDAVAQFARSELRVSASWPDLP